MTRQNPKRRLMLEALENRTLMSADLSRDLVPDVELPLASAGQAAVERVEVEPAAAMGAPTAPSKAAAAAAGIQNQYNVNWTVLPGTARDIGVGANGSVWVIGTNRVNGGYGIYRWNGSGWNVVAGGAVRISVDARGNPWVVNEYGNIFRWNGSGFSVLPGTAQDIGVGANGSVWVIGTNRVNGGYGIHRWNGKGWSAVAGGAVRISVDAGGNPWVVNEYGNIFRWNGKGFNLLPGTAVDVGVSRGAAWVIGSNKVNGGYGIYRGNGTGWSAVAGGATQVAVAADGSPWVVNEYGQIFRGSVNQTYLLTSNWGGQWYDAEKIPGDDGEGERTRAWGADDDMLCWAAAASNVLAWTGWGGNNTPDAMLRYYATHWTDFGQAPKHAWNWWFNAINPTQGDGTRSNVDVAGGGFFRNVRFDTVAKWNLKANQSMSAIDTYLHQGYGITLTINNSPLRGCHAITCWGFDYDPNKPGSYRGVWVTDSDDAKTLNSPPDQLRYYSVSYANNVWSLRDYYGRNDWYITEVHGLLRHSAVAASAGSAGSNTAIAAAFATGAPANQAAFLQVTSTLDDATICAADLGLCWTLATDSRIPAGEDLKMTSDAQIRALDQALATLPTDHRTSRSGSLPSGSQADQESDLAESLAGFENPLPTPIRTKLVDAAFATDLLA